MATGTPRTRWNGNLAHPFPDNTESSLALQLSYEGKAAESDVLAIEPATLQPLQVKSREHLPDQELPTQTLFSWTETEMPGDALQSVPSQEQSIHRDFSLSTTSSYRGELEDILQQG